MHRVTHGQRTRDDSIHLTLAFVGAVNAENLARLLLPPAEVLTSAFLLTLDEWGCWARNGIGWAAPSQIPESLHDLALNLEGWLRGAGFELERRAFKPHVTLVAPVAWRVAEFALIQSHARPGGARYETLRAWPLA
jgi:2'-5' RNA ligase